MYEWIKIIHIVSSSVLFGAGIGSVLYFIFLNRQNDIVLLVTGAKQILFYSVLLTAISGISQFVTGLLLIFLSNYAVMPLWLVFAMLGYFVAAICWVFAVYLQMRCLDFVMLARRAKTTLLDAYFFCYKKWCFLGVIAFIALLCVLYLMVNHH